MKRRRATFLLLLTLALSNPASAEAFDDMFGLMFRMMLTAMNVMSDMADNNDWGGTSWPVSSWYSPWSSLSPGMGMWPAMGMGPGMGMWPGMGMGPGMGPGAGLGGWPGSGFGMSPGNSMPWGSSGSGPWGTGWRSGPAGLPFPVRTTPVDGLLDGKWYGSSGDILEIRGNRFRLRSGQYSVSGLIKIEKNLVWMYTPQTDTRTVYSFVRNQTELILQESSGNILVFTQQPLAGFRKMSYVF